MREILFRGKRMDDGEWVCGNLTVWSDGSASIDQRPSEASPLYAVDPDTAGQYTGLTVPSGKIFEHDIVTAKFKSNGARFNFVVKYSCENGGYVFDNGCVKVPFWEIRSVRIIGNIHDNPELMKGGAE